MAKDVKVRFAIARVECPPKNEIDAQFVCYPKDNNCGGCRYGDKKEDFERKIETAITRIIQQKHIVIKYRNFSLSMTIKSLSKMIAEYLGVK